MSDVTVVITTTGLDRGLDRALSSVRAQTVPAHIVVVVDGPPRTRADAAVIDDIERSDVVVRTSAIGRPGPARNAGLAVAMTPFVAFLDDDDAFLPEKLERQLPWLRSRRAILVASDAWRVENGAVAETYGVGQSRRVELKELFRSNALITSTCLASTSALRSIGGFSNDSRHRFCDDYIAWLRMAAVGRVQILGDPLIRYCVNSAGSLSQQDPASGSEAVELALAGAFGHSDHLRLPARWRLQARARAASTRYKGRIRE